MEFIDLQAQYRQLKERIDRRIQIVLDHGQYIGGPEVRELEERLADYTGARHAISCANGTDALQLALMALGIGPGDAVFTTTFTFFASAEVIALAGATPVFVDIDNRTMNICPQKLEEKISQVMAWGELNPKAIIAVDLFGLPANYQELESVAEKYNLKLVEDAAQSFGGRIGEKRAGSFGDIATTSFFPAKPLGCYGDGGAVFTDDEGLAEIVRSCRVHGKGADKYDNIRIGCNSRLDTIQAAVLLEKLEEFPQELQRRNVIADNYHHELHAVCEVPELPPGYCSAWAQYTVKSDRRELFLKKLARGKIPAMVYYHKCMHQQSAFSQLHFDKKEFKVAEKVTGEVFSLPMHPYLRDEEIGYIVSALSD